MLIDLKVIGLPGYTLDAEICRVFKCGHNTVTRYIQELASMECND